MGRVLVLLLLSLVGCASAHHHHHLSDGPLLADGDATGLIEKRCSVCHPTERIYSSVGTPEEWSAVVARMMYHHKAKLIAHISDAEAASIARWLASTQKVSQTGVRIGDVPTGRPL